LSTSTMACPAVISTICYLPFRVATVAGISTVT
jgi:hypothetical protein